MITLKTRSRITGKNTSETTCEKNIETVHVALTKENFSLLNFLFPQHLLKRIGSSKKDKQNAQQS
jgi:hypothetical protein